MNIMNISCRKRTVGSEYSVKSIDLNSWAQNPDCSILLVMLSPYSYRKPNKYGHLSTISPKQSRSQRKSQWLRLRFCCRTFWYNCEATTPYIYNSKFRFADTLHIIIYTYTCVCIHTYIHICIYQFMKPWAERQPIHPLELHTQRPNPRSLSFFLVKNSPKSFLQRKWMEKDSKRDFLLHWELELSYSP